MLENLSFYKYQNFGAVIKRFSIKKKLNVKPIFFRAKKCFCFFKQRLMGKKCFFLNIISITS